MGYRRTGHFVATALLPVVALVCFREYTGVKTPIRTIALLTLVPFVSISLAATNFWHQLMWRAPFTDSAGVFLTRPVEWGPWFLFVHAPFSYLLILVAMASLLLHRSAVATGHRGLLLLLRNLGDETFRGQEQTRGDDQQQRGGDPQGDRQ